MNTPTPTAPTSTPAPPTLPRWGLYALAGLAVGVAILEVSELGVISGLIVLA
jgi:hypothetical protein